MLYKRDYVYDRPRHNVPNASSREEEERRRRRRRRRQRLEEERRRREELEAKKKGEGPGEEDSSGSGATRGTDTPLVSSTSSADIPGTSASGSDNSVSRASSLDTLLEKPRDESPLVSSESTSSMDVAGTVDTPLTGVTDPGSGSGGWMGKMVRRLMFWRKSSSESIPEVLETHVEGTSVDPEIPEVVETHMGSTSSEAGIPEVVEANIGSTSGEVGSSTGATKGHGKSGIFSESDCLTQQEAEGTCVDTIASHGGACTQVVPSANQIAGLPCLAGMVNPAEPKVSEAALVEPSIDNPPAPETQGLHVGYVVCEVELHAKNTEPNQHTSIETIQSSIASTESRINPSPNSIQASTDVYTKTVSIPDGKTMITGHNVEGFPDEVISGDNETETKARIVDNDGSFLGSFTVHEYNPDGMVPGGDNAPDGMVPGGDSAPDGMVPGGDSAPDGMVPGGDSAPDGMVPGGDSAPDGMVPGGDSATDGMVPGGDNAPDGIVAGVDNAPDGMVPGGDNAPDGMVPGGDNAPNDTTTVNISAFDEADGVENIVENVYTNDNLRIYSIEVEHILPGDIPNIMPLSGKEGFSLLSGVIPENSVSNNGEQNLKIANTLEPCSGNEGIDTNVSPGGAKSDFGRPILGEQEFPQPGEDDASAVGGSCIKDRGGTQERGVVGEDVCGSFSPEYPDIVDTDRRLLQIAEDSMIDSSSCVEDNVSRSSLSGDFYIEGPQQARDDTTQHTSPAREEVSKEQIKPWF